MTIFVEDPPTVKVVVVPPVVSQSHPTTPSEEVLDVVTGKLRKQF